MLKITFVIHVDSYFTGLIELVRFLAKSGHADPTLLFPRAYPNLSKHLSVCEAEGINAVQFVVAHDAEVRRLHSRIFHRVIGRTTSGFLNHLTALKAASKRIANHLRSHPADLLVFGGDIVGHDMALYIAEGHALGIPSAIVPGWMAGPREPAEHNFHNPQFSLARVANKLFGAAHPHWVYEHEGRKLLRLPAEHALALETLRLAPPLPWILHSGRADVIAVESEAAREYGVREGLPGDRIAVVGSRTHDIMSKVISGKVRYMKALLDELSLPEGKRLILCALPPDMISGGGRPGCEFSDFEEMARFWMASLCSIHEANVVVSLHPSTPPEAVPFLEAYGAKISFRPVAELIPLCDLYVACISSTIQWAIACGRPVINYDAYRYRYSDYAGVEGVLVAETRDEFRAVLERLTADENFYRKVAADQAAAGPKWGILDGQAGQRILSLFQELVSPKASAIRS